MKSDKQLQIEVFNAVSEAFHLGYVARDCNTLQDDMDSFISIGTYGKNTHWNELMTVTENPERKNYTLTLFTVNFGSWNEPEGCDDSEIATSPDLSEIMNVAISTIVNDVIKHATEHIYLTEQALREQQDEQEFSEWLKKNQE